MKKNIKFTFNGKEVVGKVLDVIARVYYDKHNNVSVTKETYIIFFDNKIIKLTSESVYYEYCDKSYEDFGEPKVLFEYE